MVKMGSTEKEFNVGLSNGSHQETQHSTGRKRRKNGRNKLSPQIFDAPNVSVANDVQERNLNPVGRMADLNSNIENETHAKLINREKRSLTQKIIDFFKF
jgi:hypothetical protein